MSIRLGINPAIWSKDDLPELGGATALETCLAEAKNAGYEGIELGHKFPRQSAQLRPILERFELPLISGAYSARLLERSASAEIRSVEAHMTLLTEMGCEVMVFAETTGSVAGSRAWPLSRRPRIAEADWPGFAERLTALGDHLARHGLRMAYHPHMGTVIETEAEIDRLMSMTGDSVGLLLDTGHLTYAGADPADVARRHIGRINHVHCRDVRLPVLAEMRRKRSSFLDAVLAGVFTVPGDGGVAFPLVLEAVKAAGYSGWLVVAAEQDPAKARPLTFARMGCVYLDAAARQAGMI
jgi:inosose dehydratase